MYDINKKIIRTTIIVYGNVQKADYRGRVIPIAKKFCLVGTIQNLIDGTVKIIVEGERDSIENFYNEIKIKNSLIQVDKTERKDSSPTGEYENFYKLVGEGETLDTAARLLKQLISVTEGGFVSLSGKIDENFQILGGKIDGFRNETNQRQCLLLLTELKRDSKVLKNI